jgi:hypothetical protein
MSIKDKVPNPWRKRYQEAAFRNVQFFVESDAQQGGRRVAVHEYPKRNTPYAEDMGHKALRFLVQGYLIGPNYWDQKNRLIDALEKDGPGLLRLPLPFEMTDKMVMVMSYTVTEAREKGGYCTVEMDFVEYGDPEFRREVSTSGQVEDDAFQLEDQLIGPPARKTDEQISKMVGYALVKKSAGEMNASLEARMNRLTPWGNFMTFIP